MSELDKQKYLNDLKEISNYILTFVNAFESGKYVLIDEAKDDNIEQRKFTIKHFNEMVLTNTISTLCKYNK